MGPCGQHAIWAACKVGGRALAGRDGATFTFSIFSYVGYVFDRLHKYVPGAQDSGCEFGTGPGPKASGILVGPVQITIWASKKCHQICNLTGGQNLVVQEMRHF